MSSISVNTITDASGGATTSINGYTPTASNMAGRNRIINGGMVFDQRNAGASITLSGTNQYRTDRWKCRLDASSSSTVQQVSDAPVGFNNSLKVTIGTGAAPSSSQLGLVNQAIEGYNIADLGWGTANAKTVTVSFWVKSSVTGVFSGAVKNASTSAYTFQYTISSANTWEQKSVTIVGDTANTWVTDNGFGLSVVFDLGTGTTYQTAAGAWSNGNYFSATGSTALCATSGATWQITGVQLEEGSVATPFEHRMYGQELALCQRYFATIYGSSTVYIAAKYTTSKLYTTFTLPVTPRATPSVSIPAGAYYAADYNFANFDSSPTVSSTDTTATGSNVNVIWNISWNPAGNYIFRIGANTASNLYFSMEL